MGRVVAAAAAKEFDATCQPAREGNGQLTPEICQFGETP